MLFCNSSKRQGSGRHSTGRRTHALRKIRDRVLRMEPLENRSLLSVSPVGAAAASPPPGAAPAITRGDMLVQFTGYREIGDPGPLGNPANAAQFPASTVDPAVVSAAVTSLISVTEAEPPGTTGGNDSRATAQLLINLGTGSGDDNAALVTGSLASNDIDFYSFDLEAGDVIGAGIGGGANRLTLYDPLGAQLQGSSQNYGSVFPAASPLPRTGNALVSNVVSRAGRYTIAVSSGLGSYGLDLKVFRPALEQQPPGAQQTLFLDFDGATIDTSIFGGPGVRTLSPLSAFLTNWGLTAADESAVIDAVIAAVTENISTDIRQRGSNGDRDASGAGGEFDIQILNSRDNTDPFGQNNVSRVIIGGTSAESGISTIGIAESIDVGNFDTTESALVLLDLLSSTDPLDPNSLNNVPRSATATIIDLVGLAVGTVAAHEAGHYFGNFHTDQFNAVANVMDQGGNPANTFGIGPDGIFGTADDIDVDFGSDVYVPNEGLSGTEDTLNTIAFGLSTGRFNLSPTAFDDQATTPEDTPITVDVLFNDSDPDGRLNRSSVTILEFPLNGLASVDPATGDILYTPAADFNGNDSLKYTVTDNSGNTSNQAILSIAVTPVNDAPVAANNAASTLFNTALVIDVLGNDSDIDSPLDLSSVTIVSPPVEGTLNVDTTTGEVTYFPAINFFGTDSFIYRVKDTDGASSNSATVSLKVTNTPPSPTAVADEFILPGFSGSLRGVNVLANDFHVVDLTATLLSAPTRGFLTLGTDGSVAYQPGSNFTGIDRFTYVASDGSTLSNVATAMVISDNVRWLKAIYRDLLDRRAGDDELLFWSGVLRSGVSREAVVLGFFQSVESRARRVTELYDRFLGRSPDPGGLNHWVGVLGAGATDEQIATALVSSPEYYMVSGGTNENYVKRLYSHVLGRTAVGQGEVDFWTNLLNYNLPRTDVASGFIGSGEYNAVLTQLWITQYLERSANPTEVGVQQTRIAQGSTWIQAQAQILGDFEYFNFAVKR